MSSRACHQCGRVAGPGDRFCGGCGTQLALTCDHCGAGIQPGTAFCTSCGTAHAKPGTTPEPSQSSTQEDRRRVSVLFVDLVGFTPYAEQTDPEQVRAMQNSFFATARRVIRQHGGVVEKYIGDAVMALFGAPVATETDPLRCVRAGLELQRALIRQAPDAGLRFRVGITTGEALVDTAAARDGGQGIVTGDVVNTASRLQSAAPAGGVLVDSTTYLATREAVRYTEQPPMLLRGRSAPKEVWLAEALFRRRPPEEADNTPMVDREHELGLLVNALHRAVRDRVPQLVTILGRAGIGKSRLVRELYTHAERIGSHVCWRTGYCPPFGEDVTFAALADIVKAHAGVLDTDKAEEARARLRLALREVGAEENGRLADALAPLVGLSGSQLAAEDVGSLWRRYLVSISQQRPLVLVFEDIHLADPAMLHFVELLAGRAKDLPLLVLCTARPELLESEPTWAGAVAGSLTISLPPLRDTDIATMYAQMFGQAVFPPEMLAPLVEFADGNPLYAHEYARMLIEQGSLRGALHQDDDLPMPDNVHAVIANRIDLLDPADRTILQAAAVVGTQFWPGAVAAAVGRPAESIERALRRLEQRDLVTEQPESTMAGQAEYRFRHVLVREVCYQRLPRTERIARHERTAAWLTGVSTGRADDLAEPIARHRVAAYDIALSLGLESLSYAATARSALAAAARRAFRLYALDRAATHVERALQLCREDEPDTVSGRLQLELLSTELSFYRDTDAFLASDGANQLTMLSERLETAGDLPSAARAATLCGSVAMRSADQGGALRWLGLAVERFTDLPDSEEKATAHAELARALMLNLQHDPAAEHSEAALEMSERLGLVEVSANAMITMGTARYTGGDPTGLADLEDALAYCRGHELPSARRAASNLAWAMREEGDLPGSRTLDEQYLRTDVGSGHGLVTNYATEAMWGFFAGDWQRMLTASDAFLGTPSGRWDVQHRMVRTWVRGLRGFEEEPGEVAEAIAAGRATGFHRVLWGVLGHAALCRALQGRLDESAELLTDLVGHWRPSGVIPFKDWVPAASFAAVLTGPEAAGQLLEALTAFPRRTPWLEASIQVATAGVRHADPAVAGEHLSLAATQYEKIGDLSDQAVAVALGAASYQDVQHPAAGPLLAEAKAFAERNSAPGLLNLRLPG
nr:adenylate/guanylate cyclase domain-containing protein [Longispora albida]